MNKKQIRKRKKWPWVLGGLILVIVAAVVLLPSLMPATLISNAVGVAVVKGSIAETVVGTGALEEREDEEPDETIVQVPVGIKIDKVYFESDDDVIAGDVLATVDPLSLQQRIAAVQSEIAALDMQIYRSKDDTDDEYIRTGVSGRIKKIYTEKGDTVRDVMSDYGSLMLISISGRMAVDIETTADLSAGDEVTVVLENGSAKTGEVAQIISGGYTITLTDNGPKLGEAVEVLDKDKNALGSGTLYIEQQLAVTGTTGTVKTVHVSENEKVSRNRKLITLDNVPSTADYRQMLADRTALVDMLNTLFALSETHSIYATAGGTVLNIFVFEDTVTAASAGGSEQSGSSGDSLLMDAFTIKQADDAEVVFAIEVDELDILSIQIDQEVDLVFNALPDRQFTGTISDIATESNSQSGVAKYTVEVSLTKDESMRLGMNATATINISNKDDILTLPMEALQEFGNNIFVFTQRDEQTGELMGMKPVETGVSDGMFVEIVSGLSEGEMVFFTPKTSDSGPMFMTAGAMPIGGGPQGVRQSGGDPQGRPVEQGGGPQTQQGGGGR